MGRQTQIHQLREDAIEFLDFARSRDPVICVARDSDSEEIVECDFGAGGLFCLWNQSLLPSIKRRYVTRTPRPYYTIDSSVPVIEWWVRRQTLWEGIPALTQGRVYCGYGPTSEGLTKWFNRLVRWLRTTYAKNPIDWQSGYVGSQALELHRAGGLLLPTYLPPITEEWKTRLRSQLQIQR